MSTEQSYQQLQQVSDNAYGTHELGGAPTQTYVAPGGRSGYTGQQDSYGSQFAGGGQAGGGGGYTLGEQPPRRASGGQEGFTTGGGFGNYAGGPAGQDFGAGVGGGMTMNRQTSPQGYDEHQRSEHRRVSGYVVKTTGGSMNIKDDSKDLVLCGTSVCIFFCSFLCSWNDMLHFSVIDWMNMIYIGLFGIIMAVVDAPCRIGSIEHTKQAIRKYVNFLTRFTGKGFIYTFLGSALMSSTLTNIDWSILELVIVILAAFVICVGLGCLAIGLYKTLKLNRAQRSLGRDFRNLNERFVQFAKGNAGGGAVGLTHDDFNQLYQQVAHGDMWNEAELKLIFGAISPGPAWSKGGSSVLTIEHLRDWVNGGLTLL